jgi:hypothetical protein
MSRRRKNVGSEDQPAVKVYGFRLDETCDQRLREVADRFATTPSRYAKAVLTTHLLGHGTSSEETPSGTPLAHGLDDLGTFLRQVRDELLQAAEDQGKRLDALTARVNALTTHVNALTKRVGEIDGRLADFLTRVEPM